MQVISTCYRKTVQFKRYFLYTAQYPALLCSEAFTLHSLAFTHASQLLHVCIHRANVYVKKLFLLQNDAHINEKLTSCPLAILIIYKLSYYEK